MRLVDITVSLFLFIKQERVCQQNVSSAARFLTNSTIGCEKRPLLKRKKVARSGWVPDEKGR